MSELTPCPECQRHVRRTEATCPFCGQALALTHLPNHSLPRSRLGRAATFAFGATLASATALTGCGGEAEGKKESEGGATSGGNASGGNASGGNASGGNASGGNASGGANAGQSFGGVPVVPPYGSPPSAGTNNDTGGTPSGFGGVGLLYGAPAAGSGDPGGNPGVPPK